MKYFTYKDSGEIISSGDCPEEMIPLQARLEEGVYAAAGDVSWKDDYINNGIVTKKPPQPDKDHVFDYGLKQWKDPRTLQELKDAQWEKIKQARADAKNAPLLTTSFGTFDADQKATDNIKSTLAGLREADALGMAPETVTWTLADDSALALTRTQLSTLALLLLLRGNEAHETARLLRTQIDAATTSEEIQAISWPTT